MEEALEPVTDADDELEDAASEEVEKILFEVTAGSSVLWSAGLYTNCAFVYGC